MKRWITAVLLLIGLGVFFFHRAPSGNLAVIKIEGGIFDSGPTLRQFEELKKTDGIKAVVLRIDSPGGAIGASQEIYDGILDLKKTKTVIASLGSVAASGGYYVALPSHKIVANAGTITGSIGVRMEYLNIENLLQWARVHQETLKSGRWKDVGSPTRPMDSEERLFLQTILEKLHRQFKAAVVTERHLSPEKVDLIAEGQIFTGEEARNEGLVDELGNIQTAVALAASIAGIGKPEVFYPEREYEGLAEWFFGKAEMAARRILAGRPLVQFFY
ncbi:MAG: signal peptide peptidase SppA [Deltaproteobacteria bacterium]|nr:signal peptide peptidase SppA [Deltaproteobacteria bacterium]MBI4374383.1 signal peptide peptidase SppA [Deltaproteobacteria bacterium]